MKWTKLVTSGDVPDARFGHSLVAVGPDEIVLHGGFVADVGAMGDVSVPFGPWKYAGRVRGETFIFNARKLQWRKLETGGDAPLPSAFHACCFDSQSNSLIVHGGFADDSLSSVCGSLHALDLGTQQWRRMATEGVSPRACHGMTVCGDSIFLFGDNLLKDNVLYEVAVSEVLGKCMLFQKTTLTGTAPLPRRLLTLACIGSRIYCFGGETPLRGTTDVYVHQTGSGKWSKPLYEGSLSLRGQQGCVLGDKLMIFGGVKSSSLLVGNLVEQVSIAKKLFFLTVLEIKDSNDNDASTSSAFKFKIVTVGDSGVGKSCLLTRFVADVYSDFHVSTIGVDFKTVVTMVRGKLAKLQLWDTAGQERFSVVTGNYYRGADGFVIVYDATSRSSFDHVDQWMNQIRQHHDCGPDTVRILCANKHDLVNEVVVSETEGKEKAEEIGAIFVATSAKTSANVDLAFLSGTQKLVEIRRNQQTRPASPTGVNLGLSRSPSRPAQPSCCKSV